MNTSHYDPQPTEDYQDEESIENTDEANSDPTQNNQSLAEETEDAYSAIFEKCKVSSASVQKTILQVEYDSSISDCATSNNISVDRTLHNNIVVVDRPVVPRQVSNDMQVAQDIVSPELQFVQCRNGDLVSPEQVSVQRVEVYCAERWSDTALQLLSYPQVEDVEVITSDTEVVAQCEPTSEMYYTASSEVSLLSDEMPERATSLPSEDDREERKECVMAGHVAAMRERFENMTRANTPCPDLARSCSPTDLLATVTTSPDHQA